MSKFVTFLVWVLVLLVLALVSWGVTVFMEWPLWAIAAVFMAALGSYFLVKLLIRLVQVYRSRSRMAQLTAAGQAKTSAQLSPKALLLRKWAGAVATLRTSSLKRFGNPLHVLPWYMVVGRSGTGKTSALTRTRLAASIQKVSQSAPIEQTANYDWWFFDRAVVIDCAGRYVEAADLEQDRAEWELGLDLLAKYRGKEGLNGLVIGISAERLLVPDKDALSEEGRVIRDRIEQLIRLFGKRFPVYLLVTQCDRIYGLEHWARQLPDTALEQAMGYLADLKATEPGQPPFLDLAFASMASRLQALRMTLVSRHQVAPELLLFPNELNKLKPGLEIFLRACLNETAYLEKPFLRGLFFSSALQEGGAVSALLGHVVPPVPRHTSSTAGLFLHDFFGRVLPEDRYISLPAALRNPWQVATRNLGLIAWLLLSSAAAVLLTMAFVRNEETLVLLQENPIKEHKYVGVLGDDATNLERVAGKIGLLEDRNNNWKNHWMVQTTNIDDLEDKLKKYFIENFRRYILPQTDADYDADVARVLASDPANEFPLLMRNLVRYINLLKAREAGAELPALRALPQREHISRYTPALYARLNDLQVAYVAWTPLGDGYVALRLRQEQQLLNRVAFKDPSLTWLAGLASANPSLKPVTVRDFWRGTANDSSQKVFSDARVVAPAFTIEGKKYIDSFLNELEGSVANGPQFLASRKAFEVWYKEERLLAWQKFVNGFVGSEKTLSGEAEWRAAMGLVASAESPYYRVMDRLNAEFAAEPASGLPSWLQLSRQLGQLRTQAVQLAAAGKPGKVVGAINTVGGKAMREVFAGAPLAGEITIRNNLGAVDTLQQYFRELTAVSADSVSGPGKAYQLSADFHAFSSDPAVKSSALQSVANSMISLKALVGFASADDESIWQLMSAPLRFVLAYTEEQTSCSLQKEWESKVDWPLSTVPDSASMVDQLYGAKGTVWAFADGPAKPFIQRDANRFGIVQTLGYSVPFTQQFFPMLNDAAGRRVEHLVMLKRSEIDDQTQKLNSEKDQLQLQQSLAQVDRALADIKQKTDALKAQVPQLTITAQPTSVNAGAKVKPFATVLTIQCAAGARVLNNFNFPVSDSFPLGERLCGDVTLQIKVEDLVLTKKYPGSGGVIRFLQDFRDGARQFNMDEFPDARARLEELGVRQIGLRYNFVGQDVILRNAQQLEVLDRQDRAKVLEKQALQDTQFAQTRKGIEGKIAQVSTSPASEVSLPQRIGVCWDNKMVPYRQQDTGALFKAMAAAKLALPPAPAAGSGSTAPRPAPASSRPVAPAPS